MDRMRQVLERIQRAAGELSGTQKALIGSLVVLMVMALFLVSQYAGGVEYAELIPNGDEAGHAQAARYLDSNGIPYRTSATGAILVPVDRRPHIVSRMGEDQALPRDTTLLFNNLIDSQSWTMSSRQTEQQRNIALMNELSRTISRFGGVRDARVLIDAPEQMGLGRAMRKPTASITMFTDGGRLSQNQVDAAAQVVAGAVAGLDLERVRVIDGSNSRQFRPRTDDDAFAASYLETSLKLERAVHDKLLGVLGYIPKVIVAVNAQVDTRRTVSEESRVLEPGSGTVTAPLRESTSEIVQRQATRGAEPGVRPNTGLSIDTGGGSGEVNTQSETDAEFETRFGTRREHTVTASGAPLKVNATVNVPRSYVVKVWRQQQGEDEADPTDADLQPLVDVQIDRIREQVAPLLESAAALGGGPGEVVVNVIPDVALTGVGGAMQAGIAGGAGGVGGAGGGGAMAFLEGGAVKTIVLGGLALAALAAMSLTVRKATKQSTLPSAEELVGAPPTLQSESDLVGEAGEADSALAGIELGDEQIKSQKILEQVEELVRDKPGDAAGLLNRWIQSDQ